ncbi:MAG: T9SS C-terminal target domain-containing protein, partial [Verrucomicrobiae bacterium]|nr:T9SS C-terminal target domain-containing protein [Verrucomicrobiae bacterium]
MKTKLLNLAMVLAASLLPASLGAVDVQVTQPITNNVTWLRTNTYFLNGPIYVLSNATLTIEAGTVIKGRPGGTNDASALFICQGGKIYANGTPSQPIIFTAEEDDVNDPDDLGIYDRGKWG